LFEHFVRLWRQDLDVWGQRVAAIGRMPSLDAALQALDLARQPNGRVVDLARPRSAAASEAATAVPFGTSDTHRLFRSG
jgi:hypothetical protein